MPIRNGTEGMGGAGVMLGLIGKILTETLHLWVEAMTLLLADRMGKVFMVD